LTPGHTHDPKPHISQRPVAAAIPFKSGPGPVIGEAVHLHDQSIAGPEEVDLKAPNGVVDAWNWKPCPAHEGQEPGFRFRTQEGRRFASGKDGTKSRGTGSSRITIQQAGQGIFGG
jgi:hypothetical protein